MRNSTLFAALLLVGAPAAAQMGFSQSYVFLKAVKDNDGNKVTEILSKAASAAVIINTKDQGTGDTALHLVTRRRDTVYLNFLLSRGANPNVRNNTGQTPLLMAAQTGWNDGLSILLDRRADPNLGDGTTGETPLIRAVQNRDMASVVLLLRAGADPKRAETGSGLSARDYAARDPRAGAILRTIDDAKPKPKAGYGPN